ncbi:MAG: TonB-dependent receptor [Desulfobacterales bacterium]
MKKDCVSLLAVVLGIGLMFGGFSVAFAQDEPKAEFTLDEIVVTAERRESTVQDTPLSVSAWDATAIDEQAINGIVDLQMRMPSTTFTSNRIFIRGVGREINQLGSDPGVGLFFDGFYNSEQGGLTDLFDVERIESIRGPQSTLYGRATLGGAINVLYVRPTSEWSGQVKARYGNYDDRAVYAAFGGSLISDVLMARVVATARDYGGHQENVYLGRTQGDSETISFAVKLLYQPTDRFSTYLKYEKSEYDGHPPQGFQRTPYDTTDENYWYQDLVDLGTWPAGSYYKNPTWDDPDDNLAAPVNVSLSDPWEINTNVLPVRWLDANQIDLTTTVNLGGLTIKHLAFYRDWDYYSLIDWDYGPYEHTSRKADVFMDVYEWSQELQVLYGGEDTPFSFIGGLYYYTEHRNQDFDLYYVGDGYWESIYSWPGFAPDSLFPGFPGFPGFTPQANRAIYWYKASIDDQNKAAYAQVDYQITDQLNISVGARYTIDEKEGTDFNFYQYFVDFGFPIYNANAGKYYYHGVPYPLWRGYPHAGTAAHVDDWSAFLYKVGADYKPSEATLLYATLSRGYKPGGFVLGTIQGLHFDAEYITSYEIGWKQLWLDDRFRTNTTVYLYDYQDKQVPARDANETRIWNAASANNFGLEFEGTGYIAENFLATISYSYMNTEYENYTAFDQSEPLKGFQDLSGNPLTNSPEHKFAISGTYTIPTDIGDFSVYAIYFWQDEVFYQPFATSSSRAAAWDRVDTRLAWNSTDYNWRISLYVKNAFDEIGYYGMIVGGPYEGYWQLAGDWDAGVTPPRQFGVEVSYKW